MNKIFSNVFFLSEQENTPELVEEEKVERNRELQIALAIGQQKDGRSLLPHWTDWQQDLLPEGIYRYSRFACLLLTDPEEAKDTNDLVWLPHLAEARITEYTTRSGKVFRPVGSKRWVWKFVTALSARIEGS